MLVTKQTLWSLHSAYISLDTPSKRAPIIKPSPSSIYFQSTLPPLILLKHHCMYSLFPQARANLFPQHIQHPGLPLIQHTDNPSKKTPMSWAPFKSTKSFSWPSQDIYRTKLQTFYPSYTHYNSHRTTHLPPPSQHIPPIDQYISNIIDTYISLRLTKFIRIRESHNKLALVYIPCNARSSSSFLF